MKTIYAKITVKDTAPCLDACISALRGDVEIKEIQLPTEDEKIASAKQYAHDEKNMVAGIDYMNGCNWYKKQIEKQ